MIMTKLKPMIKKMRDFDRFFAHVKSLGFTAKTIIDVGFASGTAGLYCFKGAYLVLIDALEECAPDMEKLLANNTGELHVMAVSDSPGFIDFFVSPTLDQSTLNFENVPEKNIRRVEVDTLENLLADSPLEWPVVLKTDIQGADLSAVRGAGERILDMSEIIIMEVSTFGSWGGIGPDLTDVIIEMDKLDFVVYDIIGYLTRSSDAALGQIDIAFVKREGIFRKRKLW